MYMQGASHVDDMYVQPPLKLIQVLMKYLKFYFEINWVLHQNVPIKFCCFLHYKHFNEKLKTNYNDICNSIIVLNRAYIVQFLPHQNQAVYTLKKADFQLTAELPSWFT